MSTPIPLALGLGPTELLIIFAVIVLLFGASKLPDLARGSGRAIRIFKAETKGVLNDDEDQPDSASELESKKDAGPGQGQPDAERSANPEA
ncbi:MAG TPA: Sec-independent protein translocase subunit TatA [Marmoricola sp.]|jgi:sec-independent protein translocase protein TatA|nr:Sec-independent protein translocase subunit TatA [Nocardioidaceae bacterium]MCB8992538.1 Sec-independent protein translocase subunit TatA [Nocardioidaceae bacterium]HRV67819.1 Sec-independent protein translocase subunit TatA [Marmoricola sp.]